ncbi:heavy-metal-associated domain-containing protein, partial [bacterium]|nr:heavy-metal-associated domain-containing protein [bacterium]
SKADCAAKCASAKAATASAGSCEGKTTAAAASSCEGKAATASAGSCAGKATAAAAGSCAGKAADAATAGASCDKGAAHASKHAECGGDCAKACCAGKSAAMITYKVSGMTCMGCVKQVEAAVAKMELDNVESVSVSLDGSNAVVTTTGPVDAMAVAEAITKAGFQAEFAGAEHAQADKKTDEEAAATM